MGKANRNFITGTSQTSGTESKLEGLVGEAEWYTQKMQRDNDWKDTTKPLDAHL
jgi:hypothetical protein